MLDQVTATPIVVMGASMGAAIALQAAAVDARIAAVVSVSSFSDLRTAAIERTPFFASQGNIAEAFKRAEAEGAFHVDDVSPMAAAAHVSAATLLIHGDRDDETPPSHSRRIFAALHDPKRLILVPNAGHGHVVDAGVWREIDGWLDATLLALPRSPDPGGAGSPASQLPRIHARPGEPSADAAHSAGDHHGCGGLACHQFVRRRSRRAFSGGSSAERRSPEVWPGSARARSGDTSAI